MEFKGKQTSKEVILMAVRWYAGYSLSYRNVEEFLKERGLIIDHSSVQRWVVEYSPKLLKKFWNRRKKIHGSWYMDETYVKVKGKWHYLYRAVDKYGYTVDFYLSKRRDGDSARKFFEKAIKSSGLPIKVNIDKSGSNTAALKGINKTLKENQKILIRQNKYLNNLIEQDHRMKRPVKYRMGFKKLSSARATLCGMELHHMLKKGQFKFKSHLPIWEQFCSLAG